MYKALVTKIITREFPNADRLLLATVTSTGEQIIVGKETTSNELGLYFSGGGQLGEHFAELLDLVRRKDTEGNPAGGMFELNRRIKCIKLRGERSEGFWISLNVVGKFYKVDHLNESDELDQLILLSNNKPETFCQKYYSPATLRAMNREGKSGQPKKVRPECNFPEHVDTSQWTRNKHRITHGALVTITEKVHGTSVRISNLEVTRKINRNKLNTFFAKVFKKPTHTKSFEHLTGTRHTIQWTDDVSNSFYKEEGSIYKNHSKNIVPRQNEIIFAEIVGYTPNGGTIMSVHDTTSLKDKEITKQYGPQMTYSYGCEQGDSDLYVYRIAMINPQGYLVDYSWNQIVQRCKELELKTVPLLYQEIIDKDSYDIDYTNAEHPHIDFDPVVATFVELTRQNPKALPSTIDPRHVVEGVVIRIDDETGTHFYKDKNIYFKILEGIATESDSYIDTEDAA